MRTKPVLQTSKIGILLVLAPLILSLLNFHSVAATPAFFDTLSNNSINQALWKTQIFGTGPIVSATNQSIITTLPAISLNDPQAQVFSGAFAY